MIRCSHLKLMFLLTGDVLSTTVEVEVFVSGMNLTAFRLSRLLWEMSCFHLGRSMACGPHHVSFFFPRIPSRRAKASMILCGALPSAQFLSPDGNPQQKHPFQTWGFCMLILLGVLTWSTSRRNEGMGTKKYRVGKFGGEYSEVVSFQRDWCWGSMLGLCSRKFGSNVWCFQMENFMRQVIPVLFSWNSVCSESFIILPEKSSKSGETFWMDTFWLASRTCHLNSYWVHEPIWYAQESSLHRGSLALGWITLGITP